MPSKNAKSTKPKPFAKLHTSIKENIMLQWFVEKKIALAVLDGKQMIEQNEKYFSRDAWQTVIGAVKLKMANCFFTCKSCNHDADESPSVQSRYWYCRSCIGVYNEVMKMRTKRFHGPKGLLEAVAIPRCISTLGLRPSDIEHLQSGQMLEDTHMMAAQNLIQQQFPQLLGCQSTLLCQNKQFVPVNGNENAIQILYNGHYHWVTVVCTEGKLYLCDSLASDKLTQTLKESIRVIFQNTSEDSVVTIHRLPVQQQKKGSMNCGIYAIAYAFHAADGTIYVC
ncbi:hypothetical protein EMCRGX_G019001 [Ephydatia muelleri]